MRILVIGATGTIGKEVVAALSNGNEIIGVSHKSTPITVDIANVDSIKQMYASVGKVDAVISAAGNAAFKPLLELRVLWIVWSFWLFLRVFRWRCSARKIWIASPPRHS